MRKIYFDEDVDLAPLNNRVIGVIGYGNQGSAQARNLRDSGLEVIVGNRRDAYYQEAERDGFPVFSIARATARADLVLVGLPDEVQQQVYERHMQKHIRGGQVLDFASSYGYRFKCIQPPPDVDVVMMSPRAMGITVRELFVQGKGVPAFVAVGHDASGQARQIALALAKGGGVHPRRGSGVHLRGRGRREPLWRAGLVAALQSGSAALLRGAGGGGSSPRAGRPGVLRLRRGRRDFPEDGGRGNVRADAPSLTHLPIRNAVTVPRAPPPKRSSSA